MMAGICEQSMILRRNRQQGGVERIIGVVCMVGFAQLTTRIAIVTTVHNSTVEFLLAITGSLVLHRAAT
jgi:hypothetical protein